jgi:hypothetical protein
LIVISRNVASASIVSTKVMSTSSVLSIVLSRACRASQRCLCEHCLH